MQATAASELVWTKRKPEDSDQQAWLEGEPAEGHVMGVVYDVLGGHWRYWVGCNNPERTLTASMEEQGWIADSEAEAKTACEAEMRRLRRWANSAGPESIPALEWGPNPSGSGQLAAYGCVNAGLYELAPSQWELYLDATVGAPEEKGYLRAIPVVPNDSMCFGCIVLPTEATAKEWAQEKAAALCRWLGGELVAA